MGTKATVACPQSVNDSGFFSVEEPDGIGFRVVAVFPSPLLPCLLLQDGRGFPVGQLYLWLWEAAASFYTVVNFQLNPTEVGDKLN